MNRSLVNVLFGGIAAPAESAKKLEGTVTKVCVLYQTSTAIENYFIDLFLTNTYLFNVDQR